MQFNRTSEADEAIKDYAGRKATDAAKKQVKKAVKKAGKKAEDASKKAGKAAVKGVKWAAHKMWIALSGALGVPAAFCIIVVVMFLFLLPGLIFSSSVGLDNASGDATVNAVGDAWENDAQAALNERHSQLTTILFWNDLGSFFSSGSWGQRGEVFQTEYAKANDLDEDGESVSEGYFSASNRLIAILNETFKSSLNDNARAMRQARKMAEDSRNEYEARIQTMNEYQRPDDVAPEDYHVVSKVEKDPFIDQQNFIYESCYMLAATSAAAENNDSFATGVRDTLDYAFLITGLDYLGTGQKICWEPYVNPAYSVSDEEVVVGYKYYDADGNEVDEGSEDVAAEVPVMKKERTVTVTLHYSVMLKSDYKEIVLEHCGIEDMQPDEPSFEMDQKEQIQESAIQLMKFYGGAGGFASIGETGLPLPAGSYYISSVFGWRILRGQRDFHSGVDLAAPAGTNIFAVKDGVCTVTPYHSSYGYYVTIDHGNGLKTRYAHMSAILVANGQEVKAGQVIGLVGTTGNSTGNHLHLEVIVNGDRVDPLGTELGGPIQENTR